MLKLSKINTDYGYKGEGNSHFIFVAPHAGGDDLKTAFLATRLALIFDGYFLVNNTFFKKTNSRAHKFPERVEDFNKLSWSKISGKYLWAKKKPEMKKFFTDIEEYCRKAREKSPLGKAIVVYLHGMKSEKYLFDLGVGLRAKKDHQNKFRGTSSVPFSCSGVPTIPISILKKLKTHFIEEVQKVSQEKFVGVGTFPAWSRKIAAQFHKNCGRDDWAMQLEVNKDLRRDNEGLKKALKIIKEVFAKVLI